MALVGRLHPLLVHFPIALALVALAAEAGATATGNRRWRHAAILNVRVAALCGLLAAVAGWQLGREPGMATPLLAWHRWIGMLATAAAVVAALAAGRGWREETLAARPLYRTALFVAALLAGVAGHLGGVLVWGADFLRP